jgi:hypothetical protein
MNDSTELSPKKGLVNEKKKVFLTSYLSDHGIWQESHMWKTLIGKLIQ